MSDARLRRYFLGAACLWAVLNIAGGVWWLAVSWDEYRHLTDSWSRMWVDVSDIFARPLVISLAVAGFLLFLRLSRRQRLPVYVALAAGGVTWLILSAIFLCIVVGTVTYLDRVGGLSHPVWGARSLTRRLVDLVTGWKEIKWVPLVFVVLVGLIVSGISCLPPFRRLLAKPPLLFTPVGMAAGLLVISMWWWIHLPGCTYFSLGNQSPWLAIQMGIAFGSLQAFLFSMGRRYLIARMDYWEERAR